MKKELTEKEAIIKLEALCARSEHSSGEIREKLRKWGFPSNASEHIVDKLKVQRFIDDERYARLFIRDKILLNGWGRRKIEQALWQKQVDKSIYTSLLNEVADEEYLRQLRPLLAQKSRQVKAENDYERRMKLVRFALSRGFEMKLIAQCIDDAEEFCQ